MQCERALRVHAPPTKLYYANATIVRPKRGESLLIRLAQIFFFFFFSLTIGGHNLGAFYRLCRQNVQALVRYITPIFPEIFPETLYLARSGYEKECLEKGLNIPRL